ncbi:hypothetical protein ZWY2020_025513 [Hordeum vulgare]|nr:hypothetical protein ZWY2020_025513 [Hordeum vulgare]
MLEMEVKDSDDPGLSKMRKEVIAGGKDNMEVDNDFFLVPVKISDHQGPLLTGFSVENHGIPLPTSALRSHMDRAKHLPFVKRISDFHLLLQIAAFLDVKEDISTLAACVGHQAEVPEGYRLLIDALAGSLHSCAYTEVNKDYVDKFREAGLGTNATVYSYMANGSA